MNVMTPIVRDPSQEQFDTRRLLAHAAQQAIQRRYEDFMIIDVDAHHYETGSYKDIFEYIEDPVMRDQFKYTKGATHAAALDRRLSGDGRAHHPLSAPRQRAGAGRAASRHRAHPQVDGRDGHRRRLRVSDADAGPRPQSHRRGRGAYARAYNRWLTENILAHEPRIVSMLYLPMNDPVAALKMVEEFAAAKAWSGSWSRPSRYKPLYDNVYMKLYAALEERGLPLAFHAATNWGDQSMHITNRFIAAHALGFTWFNIVHMTNWVVNGMPERFPRLKSIWIESGLAWMPFLMQRLDNEYMMRSSETPSLKRKPSDYMREMFYTSQPMEMIDNMTMLEETFKMINAETQLLYSSDYPHWDMDLPSTIYDLPFLNLQAKKNILGENARKLFKLDTLISEEKQARLKARAAAVAAE